MKLLRFRYEMAFAYEMPVCDHYFTLKCIPGTDFRQKVKKLSVEISPYEYISREQDSMGNEVLFGSMRPDHREFKVEVCGEVESGVDIYACKDDSHNLMFRNQSPYTIPGQSIYEFYEKHKLRREHSTYESALHFMRKLHEEFIYRQGATDIRTTAEEAMSGGCGVCQDYAHILLSLLRIEKIPCRYIVGMMVGEGYSHAWVEVFCKGFWYGFDATNNVLVSDEYIKISHGRDYGDCIVNKGIYRGVGSECQQIRVVVEKM